MQDRGLPPSDDTRWPTGTGLWLLAALAVAAAIAFVQLFPFDFTAVRLGPFLALSHGGYLTVLGQVAIFVPLGAVESRLARRIVGGWGVLTLAAVSLDAMLLGLACETAQVWLPGRSSSLIDLCADTIGGVAGYLLATSWTNR